MFNKQPKVWFSPVINDFGTASWPNGKNDIKPTRKADGAQGMPMMVRHSTPAATIQAIPAANPPKMNHRMLRIRDMATPSVTGRF